MEYRSSEIKAGVFIFISVLALIFMIFALGNLQDYFKPKKHLHIVFNFTGGLEVGAPVRFAGLDIGRVAGIELLDAHSDKETERVTVITEIDPNIKIKRNSTAMIKTAGLMGGLYIDIRPGTRMSPILSEEDTLIGQDSFEFAKIGDIMEEVVAQVRKFTEMTDALISDSRDTLKILQGSLQNVSGLIQENRQDIRYSFKNMAQISSELADILVKNKIPIKLTIDHVASLTEKTDRLISEKNTSLSEIIDQTHGLTREAELLLTETRPGITRLVKTLDVKTAAITADIDSIAASLEQTLQQGNAMLTENRRNIMELVKNLNETSRHLKAFSEDLKLNPWKLIRKTDEKPPEQVTPTLPGKNPNKVRMKRLDKISSR